MHHLIMVGHRDGSKSTMESGVWPLNNSTYTTHMLVRNNYFNKIYIFKIIKLPFINLITTTKNMNEKMSIPAHVKEKKIILRAFMLF